MGYCPSIFGSYLFFLSLVLYSRHCAVVFPFFLLYSYSSVLCTGTVTTRVEKDFLSLTRNRAGAVRGSVREDSDSPSQQREDPASSSSPPSSFDSSSSSPSA